MPAALNPEEDVVRCQVRSGEHSRETLPLCHQQEATTGSALTRRMIKLRSDSIFRQDRVPAHRSTRAQVWWREHLPNLWAKVTWPGNSYDLNPIEELCWGF